MRNLVTFALTSAIAFAILAALAFSSGCLTDTTAPDAPVLDPLPATTVADTITVTGTAEYFGTVVIAGGKAPASTTADGRTGRFAVAVPLTSGVNHLRATVTDSAGNKGAAAAADVTRDVAHATVVRLALESGIVDADAGALAVQVDVSTDEAGVDLSTLTATLAVSGYPLAIANVPVAPDRSGHARVVVTGLTQVGAGLLTATADVGGLDGVKAQAQSGFIVIAGAPSSVSLELEATVGGNAVGPAAQIAVPPDTDVSALVAVTDGEGNTVRGLPSTLSIAGDASALVVGNTIEHATVAGDHAVVASLGTDLLGAQATLTVVPGDPAALAIAIDPAPRASGFVAGDTLEVHGRVTDVFGNLVDNVNVAVASDVPATAANGAAQTLTTTAVHGGVDASITVDSAGTFTFTASAPALTSASASAAVAHAAPVNAGFFAIDPAGVPYLAGQPVLFTDGFVDAFGNAFFDVPLVVSVNAPNVQTVVDGAGHGEIDGITRAGVYTVTARAIGSGLADVVVPVVVGANPAATGVHLALSASLIAQGGSLLFFVNDGFGNPIAPADVAVTASGPSAVTQSSNELTFPAPGNYAVTACLVAQPALCDTALVNVAPTPDVQPPTTNVTVTFPDPAVTSQVQPRGLITVRVDSSDDRGLASVRVVADFGGNIGCNVSSATVLVPAGTLRDSRSFSFSVPRCAVPLDKVVIISQATDEAGNTANSNGNAQLVVASPFSISAPGFIVSVAAFGGRLDGPDDVVADAATGELFVTNTNADEVVVVAPDRTQSRLVDQNGNQLNIAAPEGIAFDATGNLFTHDADAGNGNPGLARLRPDFTSDTPFVDGNRIAGAYPATPFGIAVDDLSGRSPLLCAAIRNADRVQCFTNVSAAAATPTLPPGLNVLNLASRPVGVAFDPASAAGDALFVAEGATRALRVLTFNAARTTLTSSSTINLNVAGGVQNQNDVGDLDIATGTRNLMVSVLSQGKVLRVTQQGAISTIASGFSRPAGLAFDGPDLLVVDNALNAVFRISPDPSNPAAF